MPLFSTCNITTELELSIYQKSNLLHFFKENFILTTFCLESHMASFIHSKIQLFIWIFCECWIKEIDWDKTHTLLPNSTIVPQEVWLLNLTFNQKGEHWKHCGKKLAILQLLTWIIEENSRVITRLGIMDCQGRELWISFIAYGTNTIDESSHNKLSLFIYIQNMQRKFKLAV